MCRGEGLSPPVYNILKNINKFGSGGEPDFHTNIYDSARIAYKVLR